VEWFFAVVGLVVVVAIALVVVGRETARLAMAPRPAVFDVAEGVEFIADRLPSGVQARLTHDDVRWILLADADLLEEATREVPAREVDEDPDGRGADGRAHDGRDPEQLDLVDEDEAVARILALADSTGRELADEDVVAVLDGRSAYLEAIGAIGPAADAG
jgi:hypothetical protein